jgi:hypothetical protein
MEDSWNINLFHFWHDSFFLYSKYFSMVRLSRFHIRTNTVTGAFASASISNSRAPKPDGEGCSSSHVRQPLRSIDGRVDFILLILKWNIV